jgi:hypothetical protein
VYSILLVVVEGCERSSCQECIGDCVEYRGEREIKEWCLPAAGCSPHSCKGVPSPRLGTSRR